MHETQPMQQTGNGQEHAFSLPNLLTYFRILAVPLLTAGRIFFENVPSLRFLGMMMDR